MATQSIPTHEPWVLAQAAATEAEQTLCIARLAASVGQGPPVSARQIEETLQLRVDAAALMKARLGDVVHTPPPAARLGGKANES